MLANSEVVPMASATKPSLSGTDIEDVLIGHGFEAAGLVPTLEKSTITGTGTASLP
jgi:hypothetical protein